MNDTVFNIEHNLVSVLTRMEMNGVGIDKMKLIKVEQKLTMISIEKIKHIQSFAINTININSTKQLSQFLFNELKLEPP